MRVRCSARSVATDSRQEQDGARRFGGNNVMATTARALFDRGRRGLPDSLRANCPTLLLIIWADRRTLQTEA